MKTSQELIFNIVKNENKTNKPLKPINALQEVFSSQPVTQLEKEEFYSEFSKLVKEEKQELGWLERDLEKIIKLSKECHSVQKQGVILLGEKISQAKSIFSIYSSSKPLFSFWVRKTFSSEKTAYNALAYFEFYTEISNEETKEKLKKMPLKAGYALASRKGSLDDKLKIVDLMYHENSEEILLEIQQRIPMPLKDGRKKTSFKLGVLKRIEQLIDRISLDAGSLDSAERKKIQEIKFRLTNLCKEEENHV